MITLLDVNKLYEKEGEFLAALYDVNLQIDRGDFVAITGPSGSGKSTLLTILGCLDTPSSGQYILDGHSIDNTPEVELARIRNKQIGFVFQSFNLIPTYTALRNVELPMLYAGMPADLRTKRAALALNAVGLGERLAHLPAEMSGGQQQRVAIARAIVNNPNVIIADEPTGSLDDESTAEIMELFSQLHQSGRTIIFVTHNLSLLSYASKVIRLSGGKIVNE
ncbi:MAG: ABC transporter ATP-binding protein [Gammaproteobacteria bacterium]|nr:ABC transporter ATP-binding protein [Gammaproteobacteria bacterium]